MIHQLRKWIFPFLISALVISVVLALFGVLSMVPAIIFAVLTVLALRDRHQSKHSILRNYPLLGHLRYLLEDVGPELRQYIVEDNLNGRPFNRDERSLAYQRAKGVLDKKGFGTEHDVYEQGHRWITHSLSAHEPDPNPVESFRFSIGGAECTQPYLASLLNISAMSFGSLSGNAIRALNEGARFGGFAHNTGEGGVSKHHREPGGDLVWQIGTGYFGCRTKDGDFDPDEFAEQAALPAVKMIELKLSQGAKPGHGGILPGKKVNAEIAEARGVAEGGDCISPPSHKTFDSPKGLLRFVDELRSLSGGKPVGIKLSIGEPVELMSIFKAMHETGSAPDFVTIDGGEGGTGAAPIEFADHMGMPALEAIVLANNALIGMGARDEVRLIAAGRLLSSVDIAMAIALGADGVNMARGFMFSLGCIQSKLCHTNDCPVGVATTKDALTRGLHVETKSQRVANFHKSTLDALAEVVGATGLTHPHRLAPSHLYERVSPWEIRPFSELYPTLEKGELLDGNGTGFMHKAWRSASTERFGAA